jgi:hypothetical protein
MAKKNEKSEFQRLLVDVWASIDKFVETPFTDEVKMPQLILSYPKYDNFYIEAQYYLVSLGFENTFFQGTIICSKPECAYTIHVEYSDDVMILNKVNKC